MGPKMTAYIRDRRVRMKSPEVVSDSCDPRTL